MFTISAINLQESLYTILKTLKYEGRDVVVRGLKTRELHPCFIEIMNPQQRHLLYPKRGNNPFASLAETMWVLAGRDDVKWLEKFLPRCKDYSDDGLVWRAAYGPRLRYWVSWSDGGNDRVVDQIQYVVETLKKDPASRQAVISIWDPAKECAVESSKDYPCNNWIHYMIRDGVLDCTVAVRSNDSIFGYSGINVYEWTVLQEIIAKELKVEIGMYYHLSDSIHVYEKHYEKMYQLFESYIVLPTLPPFEFCKYGHDGKELNLNLYLEQVENLCYNIENGLVREYDFDDLTIINKILYFYLKENRFMNLWCEILNTMPLSDLKVALHYWVRKNLVFEGIKFKDGIELINECIEHCTI